jgi:signal transduction histidine kinase
MSHRVQATQQSQRDFIVNVSHELKTPLTSVQGFAQAILDGAVASQSDLEHAAGVIRNEAERMNRLVLDLLELARFEAGTVKLNIQSIEAGELLRSVAQRFSLAASQAQVKLELDVQQPITFLGDGDRLGQVLNNLVDNAIKYSPSGGRIILQAKQVDGKINLAVKDNGPGIPDEESSRIFERFYQIDRARRGGRERGVGLGLAIAREIVQAHGGFIHVEKNPPQGSSFVVNLQSAHL